MTKIKLVLWILFLIVITVSLVLAQKPRYIQLDYKDLVTRQRIDRDLYQDIQSVFQADTLIFTSGQTADTVYLEDKYSDTDFLIFFSYRAKLGTIVAPIVLAPLSDSSFIFTKGVNDTSTVQWMAIYK